MTNNGIIKYADYIKLPEAIEQIKALRLNYIKSLPKEERKAFIDRLDKEGYNLHNQNYEELYETDINW